MLQQTQSSCCHNFGIDFSYSHIPLHFIQPCFFTDILYRNKWFNFKYLTCWCCKSCLTLIKPYQCFLKAIAEVKKKRRKNKKRKLKTEMPAKLKNQPKSFTKYREYKICDTFLNSLQRTVVEKGSICGEVEYHQ